MPIARGGNTTIWNVLPSCYRCNQKKGAADLLQWNQPDWWWAEFVSRYKLAHERFEKATRADARSKKRKAR